MYDTIIIIISNGGIIVDKKTAVITGASRGIGSYTALNLQVWDIISPYAVLKILIILFHYRKKF